MIISFTENIYLNKQRQFETLEQIDLSNNQIETLNLSFTKAFESLQKLYLQINKIDFMTNDLFFNTKNLTLLYLNQNLAYINDSVVFSDLSKLEVLSLEENDLNELLFWQPRQGLKNLKILLLRQTKLANVKGLFSNLFSIEVLEMPDNEIEIIEAESFKNYRVKVLYLFSFFYFF